MYGEHPPPPGLAGRVACLWHQTTSADGTHLVVPDGCVDLIWGPTGVHVAGPDTGPMPTPMRVGDTYAGVRFLPGAVGEVFGVPVEAMRDMRVPTSDLPSPWREMAEEGGAGIEGRARVLLTAVEKRLRETGAPDPAAGAIAAALRRGVSVREVAWDLGFSERQLHRRSVGSFGYSPKTLQRIVRFQRALRLARAGVGLAEVAAESGYADQAHLANDVKRLSGVPMTRLLGDRTPEGS
ncbi:DUF6597 domain-containing transcriptional factor [Nonomuraea sp. NPDC050556]|uniref:DUF6597 domain-containing transcriptional factor n=1 Tax=Nonomuraea sp. NPDC050556 TaxID=3364369 RepID=UPI0037BB8A30